MLDDIAKVRAGEAVTTKVATPPFMTRRRAIIFGGSFFAAIALAITGLMMSGGGSNSGPMVPNVVGLSEEMARALLSDYSITIKHAHDAVIPKDRVASQLPLATTHAKAGSSVVLTISAVSYTHLTRPTILLV